MKKVTVEELLAKAHQPSLDAPRLHKFYKGKMGTALKCRVRDFNDFAIWYTPGVAAVCKEIPPTSRRPTSTPTSGTPWPSSATARAFSASATSAPRPACRSWKARVSSSSTWAASTPSRSASTKRTRTRSSRSAGRSSRPSAASTSRTSSSPSASGSSTTLRAKCEIPVWHDDQQGTACVTVAGLINALKIVKKDIAEVKVTVVGSGASGINISRQIMLAGANPANMLSVDSKGILSRDRADKENLQKNFKEKWDLCLRTNPKCKQGSIADALQGADVLISASHSRTRHDQARVDQGMAKDAIVFAEANPIPEIWPWEAKEAGARIVATGRSDFPNQVNNSLGFPGIFRGALDVRAKTITDDMCIAAARELAKVAEDKGIHEDYIIPNMDEWEVFPREAVAVGTKAIEEGVARFNFPADVRFKMAEEIDPGRARGRPEEDEGRHHRRSGQMRPDPEETKGSSRTKRGTRVPLSFFLWVDPERSGSLGD